MGKWLFVTTKPLKVYYFIYECFIDVWRETLNIIIERIWVGLFELMWIFKVPVNAKEIKGIKLIICLIESFEAVCIIQIWCFKRKLVML